MLLEEKNKIKIKGEIYMICCYDFLSDLGRNMQSGAIGNRHDQNIQITK